MSDPELLWWPSPQNLSWSLSKHISHKPLPLPYNLLYFSVFTSISLASITVFLILAVLLYPLTKDSIQKALCQHQFTKLPQITQTVSLSFQRVIFYFPFFLQLCYFATIEKHLLNDNHLTNNFVFHIRAEVSLMFLVKMC